MGSVEEENSRLREELKQCIADKEFVWMLWKELQNQNPEMTSAVDAIVTREKLRSEEKTQGLVDALQAKDRDILTLQQELERTKLEISHQNLRLCEMQEDASVLEQRLISQQLETEKQFLDAIEAQKRQKILEEQNILLEREKQILTENEEELNGTIHQLEKKLENFEHLRQECSGKAIHIQELKGEVNILQERLTSASEQNSELEKRLQIQEQLFHSKQTELQAVRAELSEVVRSRDAWANHTTLQSSALQLLQREISHLKEEISKKEKSVPPQMEANKNSWQSSSRDVSFESDDPFELSEVDRGITAQRKLKRRGEERRVGDQTPGEWRESIERELFQTRQHLRVKNEELESLRFSHDRRVKRMEVLQQSHDLLQEQLKTYETNSSDGAKGPETKFRKAPIKALRHENSAAVWNELALYQDKCRKLEIELVTLEEERDTLKNKCLRSQSSLAELTARLHHEKNDLERKLSAIAKVEASTRSRATQTHLKSSVLKQKVNKLEAAISDLKQENNKEQLQQKVNELEVVISDLKQEKESLSSQYRVVEKECYQLREDAVRLQTKIMQLSHEAEVQKLTMLSKSTMTDEASPSRYNPISVTESATQVDLAQTETNLKQSQTSSIPLPHASPERTVRQTKKKSYKSNETNKRMVFCRTHRRTLSAGDALFYEKRAHEAFKRVKQISRELQQLSVLRPRMEGSRSEPETTEYREDSLLTSSLVKHDKYSGREDAKQKMKAVLPKVSGSHALKCACQHKVVTLQKKLGAVNKQLSVACSMKQCIEQTLEEERREKGKAKTEVKELSVRLQGMKAVVQSLQREVQRLNLQNQELERRQCSESDARQGRTEADWRRMETEKRSLADRCAQLCGSVKGLEEKMRLKAEELNEAQSQYCRMERDLKQKRQLLEGQRQKMTKMQIEVSINQERLQNTEGEVQVLNNSLRQSRHKVELLRAQLAKRNEENSKLTSFLTTCQEELAQTLHQLAACQEDCERKKHLLVQIKHTNQLEVERLRRENAMSVGTMEEQIRAKECFLAEHRKFVRELTVGLEEHVCATRKGRKRRERKKMVKSEEAFASRVREIAKATLNFSDLEVDEFFSDCQEKEVAKCEDMRLWETSESAISKLPFATQLATQLLTFAICSS